MQETTANYIFFKMPFLKEKKVYLPYGTRLDNSHSRWFQFAEASKSI
jgi:hypothetical protein